MPVTVIRMAIVASTPRQTGKIADAIPFQAWGPLLPAPADRRRFSRQLRRSIHL